MTVGDREVENFMRVASMIDDRVMFLDDESVMPLSLRRSFKK